MSDLTKELRDAVLVIQKVWPLRLKAADEIERLTATLRGAYTENKAYAKRIATLEAEDKRLTELQRVTEFGVVVVDGVNQELEERIATLEGALPIVREFLWIAVCWNDHNHCEGVVVDKCKRLCEGLNIKTVEEANDFLASLQEVNDE